MVEIQCYCSNNLKANCEFIKKTIIYNKLSLKTELLISADILHVKICINNLVLRILTHLVCFYFLILMKRPKYTFHVFL